MLRHGFEVYTGCYTRMGRYNRELSARWSFGSLYSRGCYFQGGVIIRRLQYRHHREVHPSLHVVVQSASRWSIRFPSYAHQGASFREMIFSRNNFFLCKGDFRNVFRIPCLLTIYVIRSNTKGMGFSHMLRKCFRPLLSRKSMVSRCRTTLLFSPKQNKK